MGVCVCVSAGDGVILDVLELEILKTEITLLAVLFLSTLKWKEMVGKNPKINSGSPGIQQNLRP